MPYIPLLAILFSQEGGVETTFSYLSENRGLHLLLENSLLLPVFVNFLFLLVAFLPVGVDGGLV